MHQNMNVLIFLNICLKKAVLKKYYSLTILLSSFVFIFFFPKKISLQIYYNNTSMPWALTFSFFFFFFDHSTSFASPTTKLVGPCQWTM